MPFDPVAGARVGRSGASHPLPAYSFLAAADEVIDGDPSWSSGIEVEGLTPLTARTGWLTDGADTSYDTLTPGRREVTIIFDAFAVRRLVVESASSDWATVLSLALDGFALWESYDVATEAARGQRGSVHVCDPATTNLGAAADVITGVGKIVGRLGLRPGQIHLSPTALAIYVEHSAGGWVAVSGKLYTTVGRHLLVSDDGYEAGLVSPAGVAAVAGHAWVYGTDPVRYRRGLIETLDTQSTALDRAQNIYRIRIQRRYLLDGRWARRFCTDITL